MGKINVLVSRMKMVGYRTYGVVGLVLIAGVLEGLGLFTIPAWVWPLLGASGLGFLRASVGSVSKTVGEIVKP
uniref:Uncharacterized protein n=1 Tax=viral metagenome TaxID=1070528 RepID=A0A6M3Y1E2_9ZZZZ